MVLIPGYLRLELAEEGVFRKMKGRNVPTFWKEWKTVEGKEAFKAAKLLGRAKKFAIPASAMIGSDQVLDLRIDWEKNFRQRRSLLAHWVMET